MPIVANVDLQPIAIVLEFVRPTRSGWRSVSHDRTARMDESGGRVTGPPRELLIRDTMTAFGSPNRFVLCPCLWFITGCPKAPEFGLGMLSSLDSRAILL